MVVDVAVSSAASAIIRAALDRVLASSASKRATIALAADIEAGVMRHLRDVEAFSAEVHIAGMRRPRATSDLTVGLRAVDLPRRYSLGDEDIDELDEMQLLVASRFVALLGDPGAGKTTTVKRLIRTLLTRPPRGIEDDIAFPVLIVCREHDWEHTEIADAIADCLGVADDAFLKSSGVTATRSTIAVELLDDRRVAVFVDGLDEIPGRARLKVEHEILKLSRQIQSARILVTCRSGDYRHLERFEPVELVPLDGAQIRAVAAAWLGKGQAQGFIEALTGTPAEELAPRPLFLASLLTVFENSGGALPHQMTALYRRIVFLALRDWDLERGVSRISEYASFLVDEKHEFLSTLSFMLTIDRKLVRFSREDLESIYRQIAPRFGLPPGEAEQVAAEIEAYTGLIVQVGDRYEFSHLSLQEYLCAYCMVRAPIGARTTEYLTSYPAPVAIAAVLSSDPSEWLADLVLRADSLGGATASSSLLHRLNRERPRFETNRRLGHAIIRLAVGSNASAHRVLWALFELHAVRESVTLASADYVVRSAADGYRLSAREDVELEWRPNQHPFGLDVAQVLRLRPPA